MEEETERIQKELTPKKLLIKDSTALSLLRLDDRIDIAMRYIARLNQSMRDVEEALFPREELGNDVESFLDRLKEIPDRVHRWKKYVARCGAVLALMLVWVHFKKVDEAKLQALSVVNPKGRDFQHYLETFIEAATWIADAIDLNTFIEPVGPVSSPEAGGDQA